MSVSPLYMEYLDRFGATITLRELIDRRPTNAIALRHDIDHDLDLALEVAHHEHARGMRATYFLLHTARYWDDPALGLKCRQLEAYGHEVALHVNVLSEWFAGRIDDVDARLRDLLTVLRSAGVTVTGVSAHGDRACYEHGFINYWMWRELRGDDPAASEHGMSAEGIRVDDPQWQVPYPADHRLLRPDGKTFDLWSLSLAAHGLVYDGAHVATDRYWSDSGGSWSRTGEPGRSDLAAGTHQVLMHPVWWRGPQQRVYVLSTARAGSRWLANFVDTATSARGRHEYMLNHRREGDVMVADKRTNSDFVGLIDDPPTATRLLREAVSIDRAQRGDLVEANVYLEPFLPQLRVIDPEATVVHLHRNGRDVVRSILNRDWYDTPEDRRHRPVPIDGWKRLSQFERACWYYRYTNEQIAPHASARLCFEQMVSDLAYLTARLGSLGIVVHPLLADSVFHDTVNANTADAVPAFEQWPPRLQRDFDRICGPVQSVLGYEASSPPAMPTASIESATDHSTVLLDLDGRALAGLAVGAVDMTCRAAPDGLDLSIARESVNAHVVLAKGKWSKVAHGAGFPCRGDVYYRVEIDAQLAEAVQARVFALFFDSAGKQVRRHQAWVLRADAPTATFAFAAAVGATHGALAIHLGGQGPDARVFLRRLRLTAVPFGRDYRLASAMKETAPCS